MNRTPGPVRALGRCARWGLPWLCVLAISVTVAFGMTLALSGGDAPMWSAGAGATPSVELPPVESATGTTPMDRSAKDDPCATRGPKLYLGLGTWIHDPSVPCREEAP